jgi:hypothetical protein
MKPNISRVFVCSLGFATRNPTYEFSASVLKCFKDGGLDFLVNNGRHGNFQVNDFIKSVDTLI